MVVARVPAVAGAVLAALASGVLTGTAYAAPTDCDAGLVVLQSAPDASTVLVTVPRLLAQQRLPDAAFQAGQPAGPVQVTASRVTGSGIALTVVLSAMPQTTPASFLAARSAVRELLVDLPDGALTSVQVGQQAATALSSDRSTALAAVQRAHVADSLGGGDGELAVAAQALPSGGHVVLFGDGTHDAAPAVDVQHQQVAQQLALRGVTAERVSYGRVAPSSCGQQSLVAQVDQVQARLVGQYRLLLSGVTAHQAVSLTVSYDHQQASAVLPAPSAPAAPPAISPRHKRTRTDVGLSAVLGVLLGVILLALAVAALRRSRRRALPTAGPGSRAAPGAGLHTPAEQGHAPGPVAQPNAIYPYVDVAIVMESTYPFLKGGVSAVVHDIVTGNQDLTFGIIHISWDRDSASQDLYGMPANVLWVKMRYLSMGEHADDFIALRTKDLQMRANERAALAERLFAALEAVLRGDVDLLWSLYDDGVNPRTRDFNLFALLGSKEFMAAAKNHLAGLDMSLTEMFWLLREFFSLACAVLDDDYPAAGVYHAHTTGYATLLGAAAARQNGGELLLTEHNLYVRDTVNTHLDRSMHLPVTLADWRTFDVPGYDRAWMAWWILMGVFCYPSAALLTYLYPSALVEAADLGSPIERSVIIPNGMVVRDFDDVYRQRLTARAQIADPGHVWRLVFIARVVPIKGLADLIASVALLVERGISNFHVDVLGPTDHMPDYYRLCRDRMRELRVEGYFTFQGTVKVRDLLGGYDALVLSSYNEGQPIVVLEAMAAGIPTVGTEVGGMAQLISDPLMTKAGYTWEAAGLLTGAGDPVGMADALQALMRDPAMYEQFCDNARGRLVGFFQLEDALGAYNRLYRELANLPLAQLEGPAPDVVDLRDVDRTTAVGSEPLAAADEDVRRGDRT